MTKLVIKAVHGIAQSSGTIRRAAPAGRFGGNIGNLRLYN
jgi:hypothetical protein